MFGRRTKLNADGAPKRHVSGIASATLGIVFLQLLGKGSLFSLHAGLAILLGASEYGQYVYLIGFFTLLSTISLMGFESTAVYVLPKYRVQEDREKATAFIQASFLIVFVVTALFSISVTFLPFGQYIVPASYVELGRRFSFLIPILSFVALSTGILQAYQHYTVPILLYKVFLPLVLLTGCWALSGSSGASADLFLTLHAALATVIALGLGVYIWRSWLRGQATQGLPFSYLRSLWGNSWPFYEMSMLQFLLSQADLLIAGFFLGAAEVGVYGVVTRIAQLLSFAIIAANIPLAPKISETSDRTELQKLVSASLLVVTVLTVPMILGLLVFGKSLLGMFGAEYQGGYSALVIASMGQLMISFQGSVGTILQMRGHAQTAAQIVRYAAVFNILLAIVLIPMFGIVGAALASALAVSGRSYLLLREVKSRTGIHASVLGVTKLFQMRGKEC